MPGKSESRCLAIRSSSGTNVRPSPVGTKRGSISFGTFTRANVSTPLTGSRTSTPSDSERLEMYGNGRPRPTASGVRTGKIWRRNWSASARRSSPLTSSTPTIRMPCSASAGRSSPSSTRLWRSRWPRTIAADLVQRLRGPAPVLQRLVDPGLDLVVQAGDADHEELVEVRGRDRAELEPLEQRHRVVLGELEHARVELQPGELAVEEQRGRVEVELRRCGGRVGHGDGGIIAVCPGALSMPGERSETANRRRAA